MGEEREIPNNWTIAILEDVLNYVQPTEFIVKTTNYDTKYKTPVLTAGKSFLLGYTNETFGIFRNLPAIIFDDFTTAIKWVNFPFKVKSSAMKILVPTHQDVNMKYVFYFMETLRINTDTHKRYWISVGAKMEIPLPPLAEQHRIVAKIEELFSSLDKGIESLKTAQEQLKVYRQAVLKWAFEGKFMLENSNWISIPLGTVADVIDPQPSHRTPPESEEGVPYLSTKDFDSITDSFNFKKARKVSKSVLKEHIERYTLKTGDFVIGKIGTIGKPVRIVLPQDYTLSANVVLIQPKKINCNFLYYLCKSDLIESQFRKGQKATAQAAFGIQKVRLLQIPYPSQVQQEKIVSEIEKRLSVCDKIEESITTSLQQAESLRQSILKKAFEGKLVPQNPDDEPASELLKRIKAEKEKNPSAQRNIKKRKASKSTAH